jgi:hypothetical protein
LFKNKAFRKAAETYHKAFSTFGGKGYINDMYHAACAWTMAGNPDSAFYNLFRIVIKGKYTNYHDLSKDTNFALLYSDIRWNTLLEKVKHNKDSIEVNFNRQLISVIDSLANEDQKWRGLLRQLGNKEIFSDTLTVELVSLKMSETDHRNYFQIQKIFKENGYPNYDIVGEEASSNFWVLVQHQDAHPYFQDSVLQAMKIEVDKGKASASNYAYLVDRVKVNTGKLQVYGTQMIINSNGTSFQPKPVIEPDKLNERRKSIGLPSIEDYIEMINSRYYGSLKKE